MMLAITPSSSLVFSLIGSMFEVLLFINLKTSISPFCIVKTGLKKYLTTTMIAMMTEIKNRLNIKICLFEALFISATNSSASATIQTFQPVSFWFWQ